MSLRLVGLLLLTMGLAGCQSATELVVRVDSDLAPGTAFRTPSGASINFALVRFKLEMLQFGEPIDQVEPEPVFKEYVQLRTGEAPLGAALPIELGVVARGDWRDRVLGIEVRGQATEGDPADDSGIAYIYARALARFVDGEVGFLPMHLLGACSVDAGATPVCASSQRCAVAGGGPSTVCEAIPIEETPRPYAAAARLTR